MTYECSEDELIDPYGKGASYIGVGGVELANTVLAAATWMLQNRVEIFSKKEKDDGSWWVYLRRIGAEDKVKGEGDNMGEALVCAFDRLGIGGISWKLHALERRIILLMTLTGFPEKPGKKPKANACPHGVTGGRCKACV